MNPALTKAHSIEKPKSIFVSLAPVLLTIFIDLIGLSIIFPLTPAMLGYYLPKAQASGDFLLLPLLEWVQSIALLYSKGNNSAWLTTLLFGGVLGSLYGCLQFIFAPIWGKYSDRVGRKKVLSFTLLGTALAYLLWAFSSRFELYVVSRILAGIFAGNLSVANAAVADLTDSQNRTKGMAFLGVAFGLGFILGPALGGFLSKWDITCLYPSLLGWSLTPFSAAALGSFALTLCNLLWLYKAFPDTVIQKINTSHSFNIVKGWLSISNICIRKLLGINFLFTLALSGMEFTLIFLAVERFKYTPSQNGMLLVYVGCILMFTQGYIARKGGKKWGEKPTATIGFGLGMVAYFFLGFAKTIAFFYVGLTLLGLSVGLISPMLVSLVSLQSSKTNQGEYIGYFRAMGSLARAFGPLFAAILYFRLGPQWCYTLGALLFLLPLSLAVTLKVSSSDILCS